MRRKMNKKKQQSNKPPNLPAIKILVAKSVCYMRKCKSKGLQWGLQIKQLVNDGKRIGYINLMFLCQDCLKEMEQTVEQMKKIEEGKHGRTFTTSKKGHESKNKKA